MKKDSLRSYRIFSVLGIIFFALVIIFCIFIFMYTKDSILIFATLVFSFAIFLLGIFYYIFSRKQVVAFAKSLNDLLEKIINDDKDLVLDFTNETLSDKIGLKLKRLYEIVNNQKTIIKQEKHEIETILSDISHQLKTPISNLKMYHQTIASRKLTAEKTAEFQNVISKQIEKLDFLTSALMKVSRLEAGIISLTVKRQNLYDTVANALSGIVLSAEKKKITVIPPAESKYQVPHDSKWTSEALFNILDNAIKYTDISGTVKIEIVPLEMTTKIEISDTGKGIAEENHPKIFKRFYREEDVYDVEGVGIGLYLAREIITLQKGYIKLMSEVGKGTTMSIFLPND